MIKITSFEIQLVDFQIFLGNGIQFHFNNEFHFSFGFNFKKQYNLLLDTLYDVFFQQKHDLISVFNSETYVIKLEFKKDRIIFSEEEINVDGKKKNVITKITFENNEITKKEFKRFYNELKTIDLDERQKLEDAHNELLISNISEKIINSDCIKIIFDELENEGNMDGTTGNNPLINNDLITFIFDPNNFTKEKDDVGVNGKKDNNNRRNNNNNKRKHKDDVNKNTNKDDDDDYEEESEDDDDDDNDDISPSKRKKPRSSPTKKKNEDKVNLFVSILNELYEKNEINKTKKGFNELHKNLSKIKRNKNNLSFSELIRTYIFDLINSLDESSFITQEIMNHCNKIVDDKKVNDFKNTYFDCYKKIIKEIVDENKKDDEDVEL